MATESLIQLVNKTESLSLSFSLCVLSETDEMQSTMPDLGFQHHNQLTSGYMNRDVSPDSAIFTVESNFSLFSSASGSIDRCSFASDLHDHDSLSSEISQHLAGHDLRESSSGPDPDPNKSTVRKNSHLSKRVEKAKVQKEDNEEETEDENQALDSVRNSSQSLKECQDPRSRYKALLKRSERRRPASLDLNNFVINATSSSPRFGVMKKHSVSVRPTGTCPSPGTPNYRHASGVVQKGWSSERVPLHNTTNGRHVGVTSLTFNNGRTLPSKWEDAERWIFSPVAGDGPVRPSFSQPQKRPKSKSGPLGPPGIADYSLYSPAVPLLEGGSVGNLMAGSPFSAGVIVADGLSIQCGGGRGRGGGFPACSEPFIARSVSVHGCSQLLSQSQLPGSQDTDEKLDGVTDPTTNISCAVSRRDIATQMSSEGSPHSSPQRRPSLSPSTPSALSIVELQSAHSSKLEVRDVQVDERVTVTRWSKKHRARFPGKGSENVDKCKNKAVEVRLAWEVSESAKSISKIRREEAKITAWENLQKAKAEAAIRKLEMKLEKKRSSSVDKILNKLRSAQRRAQDMRSSVLANQAHQVARTSHKIIYFRRTRQISSLSGCFTCHAF